MSILQAHWTECSCEVKKSGSEGMRFQEATNINRSLLAFGMLGRKVSWMTKMPWNLDGQRFSAGFASCQVQNTMNIVKY